MVMADRSIVLIALLLGLCCVQIAVVLGDIPEAQFMKRLANARKIKANQWAGTADMEDVLDFFSMSKPKPKPLSNLTLSPACAEDIQFYRDAKETFEAETAHMKVCNARNDTECMQKSSSLRKSVAWTLEQMDATGKPPPGILRLNYYWHGSYRECISIDVQRKPGNFTGERYQGKYCYAMMSLKELMGDSAAGCPAETEDWTQYGKNIHLAVCVPKTCTEEDTLELVKQYDKISSMACKVFCLEDEEEFTPGAIAMIAIFSVIGFIVVVATVIDYVQQQLRDPLGEKPRYSIATKALLSFSMYSNGMKILDMTKKSGQLECLHGIRVLSMFWVVLGHTYLHSEYVDNLPDSWTERHDWTIEVINNATFSVDTFFTMSGFLVAYLWFKEEEKRGPKFVKSKSTWIGYYVHRYVRLTPVFMLIIGMNGALATYFLRGPHQYDLISDVGKDCGKTWWTNLLYINNVVYADDQCYGPAWYLPNDMQFYALSPIVLLLLLYSPAAGFLFSGAMILLSMAATAVTIVVYRFPPMAVGGIIDDPKAPDGANNQNDFMRLVYIAPWARFPTYLIGVLFGFAYQRRLNKVKMNKLLSVLIWVCAFATCLSILYGLTHYVAGNYVDVGIRAFYGSVTRPVWSLCICWLMFACLTGRGGPINEFLSWRGWLPLSRLSYCTYLLHYTIIKVVADSNEYPLHWDTHTDWISKWISVLVLTTIAAFFVSCSLEAPIISLEKLLLHPPHQQDTKTVKVAIAVDGKDDKPKIINITVDDEEDLKTVDVIAVKF